MVEIQKNITKAREEGDTQGEEDAESNKAEDPQTLPRMTPQRQEGGEQDVA